MMYYTVFRNELIWGTYQEIIDIISKSPYMHFSKIVKSINGNVNITAASYL